MVYLAASPTRASYDVAGSLRVAADNRTKVYCRLRSLAARRLREGGGGVCGWKW